LTPIFLRSWKNLTEVGLSAEGLLIVLELVADGAKVKATGFGRIAFDVRAALRAIADINPRALLFGTDLPSTRAPRLFATTDVALVVEALGEDADIARNVCYPRTHRSQIGHERSLVGGAQFPPLA
jgi:hypothetical protein